MPKNYLTPTLKDLDLKLAQDTVVLGIGNTLRNDDGLGVFLARFIKDKVIFKVFEGGLAPENFLGSIARLNPKTILLIDAVDFGGNSGDVQIFDLKSLKTDNFFLTHNYSLDFLANFLKNNTGASVYLLAVQPKNIALGEEISPEVRSSIEELHKWFIKNYGRKNN